MSVARLMLPIRSRRPSPALIVALLALAAAAGGVAVAAPGGGGTIQGCFNERGALRVVDTGATCDVGETALSWNQQGEAGAIGPQGPAGDVGPQGPAADLRLVDGPGPSAEPARSPALDAPVKKPKIKIKIEKKKPKIKIDPNAPAGLLFHYANLVGEGPQDGDFVYLGFGVAKTVARLELPEGRFFVTAEATIDPTGPENHNAIYTGNVRCELHTTGQGRVAREHITGRGKKSFTMHAAAWQKKGAVELRCENHSPADPHLWDITISAVTVSSVYAKNE